VKLSHVIEELIEERGLDRTVIANIISEGMVAAYNKKFPGQEFQARYNKKTDDIDIFVQREVSLQATTEEHEISLRKARFLEPEAMPGDKIWVPFEGKIGRIEILRAKQVIAHKIKTIESQGVYDEFIDKQGMIVHGVVHKCSQGGMTLKVGDALAFLPNSLSAPSDKCVVGFSMRALLKEVLSEPRNDCQLILDRSSTLFLQRLFELEIPEVFERLVEIKKIVRTPGYKSKVAMVSHDHNIDPVGTCVGVGGVRIKPVLKELGTEKIDVISWSDSPEKLIADALKPAIINKVEVTDRENAYVWLDEDQRSLAIGKMGQNIGLASKLSGYNIHLVDAQQGFGAQSDDDMVIEE
jgi:transcription termination/antitermination protein NusA